MESYTYRRCFYCNPASLDAEVGHLTADAERIILPAKHRV
jgi:hypothetical protein